MAKKQLLGMLALATWFATSCTNEFTPVDSGETSAVSFKVETPKIKSRAYSDGTTATALQYAVYDAAGNELTDLTVTDGEIYGSATVELQLTTGNEYSVIFWAAAPNAPYAVDFANKKMTVDYTTVAPVCNDETRDAFYKYHTFTVTGAQTETIELKRPFAQLNIGTADYAASKSAGYTPTKSAVTVKNVYSTLDLATGEVDGAVEVPYASADIKKDETFPVEGYEYLAMNYLLVDANKELVDIEFTYTDGSNAKTRTVGSVPVQRNYRTNIYGKILTSDVDINVEIKPEYNEPANEADDLFMAVAFGGEVTLTEDVVLNAPLEIQANVTINLNGKTLTGTVVVAKDVQANINNGKIVNTDNTVSGITSNGNLTLNNVEIESARHALRIESGNVVIDGGTYKVDPVSASTLYALNVGDGANSVANVTIKNGTFIGPKGTMADSGGAVTVKVGSTVTIEGGDFSGGKTKTISNSGTMIISGGTFDQEPAVEWIATGYHAVKTNNEYIVVKENINAVATVAEDLKNAIKSGGDILLADDIELHDRLDIQPGIEVHLDLNGKNIKSSADYLFIVREGATLIVEGNGTVEVAPEQILFYPAGNLVIENGTFIRNIPEGFTGEVGSMFVGTKPVGGWESTGVTINGGYFDGGYYDTNAADVEEILAGTKVLEETADDFNKRGKSGDKNKVRAAIKENVMNALNRSYNYFKIYGGTFVGVNPAWGDEGCMLPTTPQYLRPWSYYQGALLDGQTFNENGIVLPDGYAIEKGTHADGRPTYTVSYNRP